MDHIVIESKYTVYVINAQNGNLVKSLCSRDNCFVLYERRTTIQQTPISCTSKQVFMLLLSRPALHTPHRFHHHLPRACSSILAPEASLHCLRSSLQKQCVQVLCLDPNRVRDEAGLPDADAKCSLRMDNQEVVEEGTLSRLALRWALGKCLNVEPDVSEWV